MNLQNNFKLWGSGLGPLELSLLGRNLRGARALALKGKPLKGLIRLWKALAVISFLLFQAYYSSASCLLVSPSPSLSLNNLYCCNTVLQKELLCTFGVNVREIDSSSER